MWPDFADKVARMRAKPKRVQTPRDDVPLCRHCEVRKAHCARGLCSVCFRKPKIRAKYPSRYAARGVHHEPTEAELEAMIEQRRATMPRTKLDRPRGLPVAITRKIR